MSVVLNILQGVLLVPVIGGSIFCLLCVWAVARFMKRTHAADAYFPPVTVLKPIYGHDKGLEENLLSLCRQDYPDFQIVMSVQRENDPALPLLRKLQADFPDRVTLVVKTSEPVVNGKVQNLVNGLAAAKHEILVISDSDVRVRPDYLKSIVAPLEKTDVGYVCTLYRSVDARSFQEKMELLSLNADFVPSLIFSAVTGAADFCIGATVAFRKSDLEAIGGMADLGNYLVEDYELGRRLLAMGKRMVLLPHAVEIVADYPTFRSWWHHQIYWDQNTWAANPTGFVLTILTRAVPFALFFAAVRGFDDTGLNILLAVLVLRLGTAEAIAHILGDREGQRAAWLLPVRDLFGLVSWYIALTRRTFEWRGLRFGLTKDGRIVPRDNGVVLPGINS
ncbi:MAG: bacteriohopanetetrol glucosamine biosynthesis glycosyltransferase HpnI [Rhodospirillaceae bacterium]|nr:bacteriohopanetetrol glucosamine biosynthesis glycosyltransferase HpnI [Rhodospirillaceae bacterium]